jgi:hypothetical protein
LSSVFAPFFHRLTNFCATVAIFGYFDQSTASRYQPDFFLLQLDASIPTASFNPFTSIVDKQNLSTLEIITSI